MCNAVEIWKNLNSVVFLRFQKNIHKLQKTMKKQYFCVLFLIYFLVAFQSKAQKVISSIGEAELRANLAFQPKDKSYLKYKLAKHTPVIMPNGDSSKFMMIGFDRNSQYAFLLNQDLQVEKSFVNEVQEENTAKDPKEKKKKDSWAEDNAEIVRQFMRTYTEPLGNFSRGNKAVVIYANSRKTEFGTLMVDFDSNKFVSHVFDINLKNERFVEGFMYKGNFCLMTAGKKLDYMRFHIIEDYNKVQKYKEIQYGNQFQNLREYVFKSENWSKVSQAAVIDYQTYNELGTTQKPAKIYLTSNEVLLTFDNDHKKTDLLVLDIENEKLTVKSYPKTKVIDGEWTTYKSNSFLYYNYLVQASCTYDKLAVDFVDIRTAEKIKSYTVEKKDSISFKNTSIFQDKSGTMSFGLASGGIVGTFSVPYDNTRILKKTSQLLNKITIATLAIAINPDKNGNIKMTLGSYLERQQGGGGMMMGGGMGAAPMFIPTPMMGGYNAGKYIKSAYFESSFSLPDFEHNKERKILPTDNVLDRIRAYEDTMEKNSTLSLTYIFRRYNEFVFCYYNATVTRYFFAPFPIIVLD